VTFSSGSVAEIQAPETPRRLPSLDGFRAFSVLLVLVGHSAHTHGFPEDLAMLSHLGNYGVKFFFVISGFLITTLLLKEQAQHGSINLKNFYIRRTLRIFPALYTYILLMAIAASLGWIALLPGDLLHAATYTMNYHHERSWYLNHTWSLAVEEQFYILWPSVLVLVGIGRARIVAFGTLLAAPVIRFIMWNYLDAGDSAMTREFQAVADSLGTGCVLALIYNSLSRSERYLNFLRSPYFWFVPIVLFGVPPLSYLITPGLFYVLTQSVLNICAALMVDRWVRFPDDFWGRLLNSRPIVFMGTLSYSWYLWQEPFLNSYIDTFFTRFPQNAVFPLAAALLSYFLIEKPFLALKKFAA
jgi:peptidoglycan/LPS O-acetylase OafA/YrhL